MAPRHTPVTPRRRVGGVPGGRFRSYLSPGIFCRQAARCRSGPRTGWGYSVGTPTPVRSLAVRMVTATQAVPARAGTLGTGGTRKPLSGLIGDDVPPLKCQADERGTLVCGPATRDAETNLHTARMSMHAGTAGTYGHTVGTRPETCWRRRHPCRHARHR